MNPVPPIARIFIQTSNGVDLDHDCQNCQELPNIAKTEIRASLYKSWQSLAILALLAIGFSSEALDKFRQVRPLDVPGAADANGFQLAGTDVLEDVGVRQPRELDGLVHPQREPVGNRDRVIHLFAFVFSLPWPSLHVDHGDHGSNRWTGTRARTGRR